MTRPQLTASDPYQFYLLLFPVCKNLANNNKTNYIIDPSSHCRIFCWHLFVTDLESTTSQKQSDTTTLSSTRPFPIPTTFDSQRARKPDCHTAHHGLQQTLQSGCSPTVSLCFWSYLTLCPRAVTDRTRPPDSPSPSENMPPLHPPITRTSRCPLDPRRATDAHTPAPQGDSPRQDIQQEDTITPTRA